MRGTSVLCETIAKFPVERLIYMSSSEVYGTCLHEPMDEEHPLNPRSPYAGSKAAGDRLAYSYYVTYGIPLVIVRPFNNLGPFQHTEKVIPRFIRSALEGETIEVHDDGTQTRDWLFVTDHAEAIERCLVADLATVKGEVINLGSGVETSIRTIAEQVLTRLGHPDKLVLNSYQRPGQVQRHVSSTTKAHDLLGWRARTPFATALEQTIQWYTDNAWWWRKLAYPAGAAPAVAHR